MGTPKMMPGTEIPAMRAMPRGAPTRVPNCHNNFFFRVHGFLPQNVQPVGLKLLNCQIYGRNTSKLVVVLRVVATREVRTKFQKFRYSVSPFQYCYVISLKNVLQMTRRHKIKGVREIQSSHLYHPTQDIPEIVQIADLFETQPAEFGTAHRTDLRVE